MPWDNIPRTRCFSLGDFHDFERCIFRFFVNHHLGKKYELSEGSSNQAIGSLLDLSIKKLHLAKLYHQPADYLARSLIKAAEVEMREKVEKAGPNSFYGPQIPFLTAEIVEKAQEVFTSYCQAIEGKFKPGLHKATFWEYLLGGNEPVKLWGGPDSIEMGEDGIPEVADYKFRQEANPESDYDMNLMPKVYILLCARELISLGHRKARFVIRLWHEPGNNSLYEEFDLTEVLHLEEYFKEKIRRILGTQELSFCEKDFCKACQSPKRKEWIRELLTQGWILVA